MSEIIVDRLERLEAVLLRMEAREPRPIGENVREMLDVLYRIDSNERECLKSWAGWEGEAANSKRIAEGVLNCISSMLETLRSIETKMDHPLIQIVQGELQSLKMENNSFEARREASDHLAKENKELRECNAAQVLRNTAQAALIENLEDAIRRLQ